MAQQPFRLESPSCIHFASQCVLLAALGILWPLFPWREHPRDYSSDAEVYRISRAEIHDGWTENRQRQNRCGNSEQTFHICEIPKTHVALTRKQANNAGREAINNISC